MATCKSCGRGHAFQRAVEVGVGTDGRCIVRRCKSCGPALEPKHRVHVDVERDDHDSDMVTMEPITLEKARAQAALLQAEMTRLM